jgi:glycosyltransferase involved in cell wall biosynthesis
MNQLPPLAINGKFLAAAPTGVHRVAAELARALAQFAADRPGALDIELWVPRDAKDAAEAIGLPVRVIGPFTHIPWEQLALPIRDRRRLLLNLCNIGPVARANAITMVHDAQVYLTPQSYGLPFRLWYKGVQPLLGLTNRGLLTVSDYSRTEIAKAGLCAAERIHVVHNGLDHMLRIASETSIIERLGLAGSPYVVALASTQAHKNIGLLARAFAEPLLHDVRLVLVGDARRDAFTAQGITLPPSVVLAGRISDGELRALYEEALCLAFPSRTEGFGLPPMEAMLVGCPALVAPCGALPEICGDDALFADPDSPPLWAHMIRRLADDPSFRAQWGERGQVRAAQFTWLASAQRLLAAVASLSANATAPVAPESRPIETA